MKGYKFFSVIQLVHTGFGADSEHNLKSPSEYSAFLPRIEPSLLEYKLQITQNFPIVSS